MILTGQQKAKIKAAITKAYREEELKVLLTEEMNLSYEEIAQGGDYNTRVFNLILQLERDGSLGEFIATIKNKKPNSPYLKEDVFPTSGTPSNLPSYSASYFVGREKTLQQVHQKLQESSQLAICAVSGMGGIGKTELAVQYAIRHKEDYSGGLCWLQGRAGDIASQIVNFGRSRVGLTIPEGLKLPDQIGYCWQHWKEGQVLLIYDDVTDYQTIASLLPPGDMSRFKVLLTSRQKARANYKSIDLNVLDEHSALELLRSLVGTERIDAELDGAKYLCAWLGYLPLGLDLVGRYLHKNSALTLIKLQERLNRAKLEAQALVHPEEVDMTAKLGVAAAFELSWLDKKLTEKAKELGYRLSLFAQANISWSFVEACYLGQQVWSTAQKEELPLKDLKIVSGKVQESLDKININEVRESLENLRNQLCERSLLQLVGVDDYRLHPLIREFIILKQKDIDVKKVEKYKIEICHTMALKVKQIPNLITIKNISDITRLTPHLNETIDNLSKWLSHKNLTEISLTLGKIYQFESQLIESKRHYENLINNLKKRNQENSEYYMKALIACGDFYSLTNGFEYACKCYEKSLHIATNGNFQKDEFTKIEISIKLGEIYYKLNKYKESYDLLSNKSLKALEAMEKESNLSQNEQIRLYENIVLSYSSLANFYIHTENLNKAVISQRKAWQYAQNKLGNDKLLIAKSCFNLANIYKMKNEFDDAIGYANQALNIRKKLFKDEHKDMVECHDLLSSIYKATGNDDKYLYHYRKSREIKYSFEDIKDKDNLINKIITNPRLELYDKLKNKPNKSFLRVCDLCKEYSSEYSKIEIIEVLKELEVNRLINIVRGINCFDKNIFDDNDIVVWQSQKIDFPENRP